jgi:hypothetical protein
LKIRTDFVTNSSSSSYIMAFKNPKSELITEDELNKLNPVIKNVIKNALSAYSNILDKAKYNFTSKEEFEKYLIKNYGYTDNSTIEALLKEEGQWFKNYYNQGIDYINKGYAISKFEIDYNDESMSEFLNDICDGENIIMVEKD